ncbi:MAG: zinc-ribbon domain-containing protein [Methanomassiliicoccus sp.]|nr:zinc-ribbon domain-containing protein [Methanomassiliicoccus sp.]
MRCANCGANVQQNYQVCPYCGRPTGMSSSYNVPSANDAVPFGSKPCVSCGKTVKGTDQFCQYCGTKQW